MSRSSHANNLYAIQNVLTGEFLRFGAKVGWITSTAAKSAFNLHMQRHYKPLYGDGNKPWNSIEHLFDVQTDYVLVEIRYNMLPKPNRI